MAKFQFRMKTYLRLLESQRDERRAELAEAFRVDDVLKEQLEEVNKEIHQLRQIRSLKTGIINVDRLIDSNRHETVLRMDQFNLEKQRETVALEIEKRRQALIEADQQVKVMEKLREKKQERHRLEEGYKQAKQMDELGLRSFIAEAREE